MKLMLCLFAFLYVPSLVMSSAFQVGSLSVIHTLLKAKQTKKDISKKNSSNSKAIDKKVVNKPDNIGKSKKKKGKELSTSTIIKDKSTVKALSPSSQQLLEKLLPFVTPLCLAASMLITWKVNFADKKILFLARATFAIYMIVSQLLVMYIEKRINVLDDQTLVIEKPAVNPFAPTPITTTSEITAETIASPIVDESDTSSSNALTAKEYDLRQLRAYSSSLLMEGCMSGYMHFFQKSIKSLIFCQFMGISNTVTNNLIKIHLFGIKAEGALQRPFQSNMERMMADVLKKVQQPSPAVTDVSTDTSSTASNNSAPFATAVPIVDVEEEEEDNSDTDDDNDNEDVTTSSTVNSITSTATTIASDIQSAVNEALKDLTDSTSTAATSTSIYSSDVGQDVSDKGDNDDSDEDSDDDSNDDDTEE